MSDRRVETTTRSYGAYGFQEGLFKLRELVEEMLSVEENVERL